MYPTNYLLKLGLFAGKEGPLINNKNVTFQIIKQWVIHNLRNYVLPRQVSSPRMTMLPYSKMHKAPFFLHASKAFELLRIWSDRELSKLCANVLFDKILNVSGSVLNELSDTRVSHTEVFSYTRHADNKIITHQH